MEKGADPTFIIPDSVRFVKAFAVSIFARLRGMILRGEMMKPIMIVTQPLYKSTGREKMKFMHLTVFRSRWERVNLSLSSDGPVRENQRL